jgi:hypothetical protein
MTTPRDRDLAERLERLAAAVPVGSRQLDPVHVQAVRARHRVRMSWLTPLVGLVVLVILAGAIGLGSLGILNDRVSATTKQGDFELTLRSAKAVYMRGEPVEMVATLTYVGSEPSVRISHASSPMTFGIVEPVRGLLLNGIWLQSCRRTDLERGTGLDLPFAKSFGSSTELGPDALAFVRQPRLVLPPGTWHPYVLAEFSLDGCGSPTISMRTEISIEVMDGPTWIDPSRPTDRPPGLIIPSPTPVPASDAVHVVNLDPRGVEIVLRNGSVASLSCGETAVISVSALDSSPPWNFIVRDDDGKTIGAALLEPPLPAGIVIRDGAVLSGAWPMSYGPPTSCDSASIPPPSPSITPSPDPDAMQTSTDRDGDFELVFTSDKQVYRPGEPIHIEARLTYRGTAQSVLVGHDGLVSMSVAEKVFGKIQLGYLSLLMCTTSTLVRDQPEVLPFMKSGGYTSGSLTSSELAWLQDPVITMPIGTWHFSARASSPCLGQGAKYELHGDLTIIVRA